MKTFNFKNKNGNFINLSPTQIIFLGFFLIILLGALLLNLPFASRNNESVGFATALFTSTSATCITGLIVADTNLTWSLFGQSVILVLVQIGGLGFMSIATLFALFSGRKISLKERLTIQESLNEFSLSGMVRTLKTITIATLVIELAGATILSIRFIPLYGPADGLFKSIFHSVTSFCNAGFDIFGTSDNPFTSLTAFKDDPLILLTVSLLIITGGLGFIVWKDLISSKKFSQYFLQTQVVLLSTLVLLILGTVLFYLLEYNNPGTLQPLSLPSQILNSFFHSVTTRSAGYNTLSIPSMTEASLFLSIILMFIGAASGSTGGGVKVTTFSVVFFSIIATIKGNEDVNILRRRVPRPVVMKSIAIVSLSFLFIIIGTLVIMFHHNVTFIQSLFEATSAFGTVGLSTGITPDLNHFSRILLIFMMFIGRVGLLTAAIALGMRHINHKAPYKYPDGKITVG